MVYLSKEIFQIFYKRFLAFNLFFFYSFLGGEQYAVPYGTVVTGILDMRPGKHDRHFLVGVELLPHAFVNIPDERMHIVVFILIFITYFILCIYCIIYIRSFFLVLINKYYYFNNYFYFF
jgi:hypothetical protein